MSAPRRSLRPLISEAAIKRGEKSADRMDELVDELTKLSCPKCGRLSLVFDAETYSLGGLIVYCNRNLCSWKPWAHPALRQGVKC